MMRYDGRVDCKGGCGRVGHFSHASEKCVECRKVPCQGCGARFAPKRGGNIKFCANCAQKARLRANNVHYDTEVGA